MKSFCKAQYLAGKTRLYVKLQDAYAAEKDTLGSWELIGYTAPGEVTKASDGWSSESANFKYSETYSAKKSEVWKASNKSKLNDCAASADNGWTVTTTQTADGDLATFGALTHVAAVTGEGCGVLTPSFDQIGNKK